MLIQSLKDVLNLFRYKEIEDSNFYQKLHYKYGVKIILTCLAVLGFNQLMGANIHCINTKSSLQNVINDYCYWLSSFILIQDEKSDIYYGVGEKKLNSDIKIIAYYQWVQLFLIIQCASFYAGRFYWKAKEKGQLIKLIEMINKEYDNYIQSEDEILSKEYENDEEQSSKIDLSSNLNLLIAKTNSRLKPYKCLLINRDRGFHYVFSEVINFVMLNLQIFLIDTFLQGQFLFLGIDWLIGEKTNLLNQVFPKMTKCTFENIGPSGSTEISDALCFLPENILNEKIFIFLWFWYMTVFLITLTGLVLHFFMIYFFTHLKYHRLIKYILNSDNNSDKIIRVLTYPDFIYVTHIFDSVEFQKFDLFIDLLRADISEGKNRNAMVNILNSLNKPVNNGSAHHNESLESFSV